MSDRLHTPPPGPITGKKSRFVPVILTAGFVITCVSVLLINGCKPPEEPTAVKPVAPETTITKPKPQTETPKISGKKALEDMMKGMSESEREDFTEVLKQNPEYTNWHDENTDENSAENELPVFFPLTEDLKELIRLAEQALRMDLSDEEKLAALEELDGINNPAILEVVEAVGPVP